MTTLTRNEPHAKLPLEILEQIFTWSECDRTAPHIPFPGNIQEDPNRLNPNDEYPCLKSFSMVCKSWNNLARALLFKSIILLPNIDSWRNLQNICTTPHLAQHVCTIRLATSRQLHVYTSSDWMRKTWIYPPPFSLPNGGPLSFLLSDRNSYFARYESWCASEERLRAYMSASKAPELPLQLLSHLECVETVGHMELASVKKRARVSKLHKLPYWRTSEDETPQGVETYWRTYSKRTRREVETLIEDVYPADGDFDTASSTTGFRHMDVFSTALRNSKVSLPTLALRSTIELVGGDNHGHTGLLPGLRRLELNLGSHESKSIYLGPPHTPAHPAVSDGLSHWLQHLTHLTDLTITMDVFCREWADIFLFLQDVRFPALRTVSLKTVRTTYRTLNAFVQNHRETLKSLSIIEPRMAPEDWVRFCEQEKGKDWTMEGKRLYLTEMYSVYLKGGSSGAWFESS